MKQIEVDADFISICNSILSKNYSNQQWGEIESCDMFQTEHYDGGYDRDEQAFCFSYYSESGEEFWIQLTLEEIKKIFEKKIKTLTLRYPG